MASRQSGEQFHLRSAGVECRDVVQLLATGRAEDFIHLVTDLIDGLQAIDGKARADDVELADAAAGQFGHRVDGVGLEPFRQADP